MVGRSVLHYTILEKLGEGGMGVVYKAEDTRLNRIVALKFLPANFPATGDAHDRLIREARAASALNHPNACTIYSIDETDGASFIVMEYVDGVTVKKRIAEGGFSLPKAIEIAIQIAEALREAHGQGIVHRDIKPENVMIDARGRVKVMDFGMAIQRELGEDALPTQTIGTLAYMAPELFQDKQADARSDIFSFGVVLFEMLTGRRPFRGEHAPSMVYSIMHEDPPDLDTLTHEAPPHLNGLIRRALEKDPSRRYQSMEELFRDLRSASGSAQAPSTYKTVAVLPFDNISPDKENEYFSDGLTEEIIASLSAICTLKVVSRTSVMRFKGSTAPLRDIARDLQVQYILEGSVRKQGDDLRITAQLIDAVDDSHLWVEKYRGTVEDVFDMQEKVAARIVEALRVRLSPEEKWTMERRPTEDAEAYQLYLKGRFFWNKRSREGLRTAIRCFEEAIEKDARYALPWTGIADSYTLLSDHGDMPRSETYPLAKAAVEKALALDDRLAEAHTSLALMIMLNEWDWEKAQNEFTLSLSLKANYATTHHWYAQWLLYKGRIDEALQHIDRAFELDPLSPAILRDKGLILYYARDYSAAIEHARRSLELDPQFAVAYRLLFLAYQGKGMFAEAIEANSRWGELTGNAAEASIALAQCQAAAGDAGAARAFLDQRDPNEPLGATLIRGIALIYAALGDADGAFAWLEKAYDHGSETLHSLKVDPKMDRIRGDPRFAELLRRVGLER